MHFRLFGVSKTGRAELRNNEPRTTRDELRTSTGLDRPPSRVDSVSNSRTVGMQSQLNDVKRYFGADIQRMLQEFQAVASEREHASTASSWRFFHAPTG